MLPLFDDNPTRRVPWVTIGLIAANVAVFIYMLFLKTTPQIINNVSGVSQQDLFVFKWSVIPWEVVHGMRSPLVVQLGISKNVYLPIFTSMFLHSGWLHIGGNMLFLWVFGNNIEDLMGPLPYLAFYFICGFAATFTHILFNASSMNPLLGASGAIAGILAAYLIMYPRARVHTIVIIVLVVLPAYLVLGFWIVLQVISGVTSLNSATGGGTAWFAHVGGIAAGLLITGIFYAPLKRRRVPAPIQEIHRFFQPRDEFNRPYPPGMWPPAGGPGPGAWPPPPTPPSEQGTEPEDRPPPAGEEE